jgi:hypothetical protein
MRKYSLSALAAAGLFAGGFGVSSATAADLGGNCCADLEERVAELEATTARKGNRKVSLTVSGWVGEQVMWWDDGRESNTYVTGLGTTLASHFKITGEAQISPGWSAGYVIQVEVETADPLANLNQNKDDGAFASTSITTNTLQSYWFIKSEQLGKLSVGQLSPASDNTAILVDGSGSLVPANWVVFDNNAFFLRQGAALSTATWGDLAHCPGGGNASGDCGANGGPGNFVRYDSPTFAGFSVSADWGEDDMWDVAARYAGEWGGFKVAVAASYFQTTDGFKANIAPSYWQVGGYIQHIATGLFAYGAYGKADNDQASLDDGDAWYVKGGIRQRWTSLGHTVLYGEYGERNDMFNAAALPGVDGSQLKQWGVGLVQEIDAAAMSLWISYRHFEGEVDCFIESSICGHAVEKFEDFDLVKAGALISF